MLGRRTVVVSLRLPHAVFASHSECFGEAERFGGEMVMFRVKERGEGGEEDLTGSMLPTHGEDAHLQPTDASTTHRVDVIIHAFWQYRLTKQIECKIPSDVM